MLEKQLVSKGLKLMFVGQIVGLLGFLPLVGGLLGLIGAVVEIVGLVKCTKWYDGYRYALIALAAGTVCGLLSDHTLFLIGGLLCSVLEVYFVCTTTDALLAGEGLWGAQRLRTTQGSTIWKVYLGCNLVALAVNVLAYVPILNILAVVAALVVTIVGVVAGVLYIIYLYQCSVLLS